MEDLTNLISVFKQANTDLSLNDREVRIQYDSIKNRVLPYWKQNWNTLNEAAKTRLMNVWMSLIDRLLSVWAKSPDGENSRNTQLTVNIMLDGAKWFNEHSDHKVDINDANTRMFQIVNNIEFSGNSFTNFFGFTKYARELNKEVRLKYKQAMHDKFYALLDIDIDSPECPLNANHLYSSTGYDQLRDIVVTYTTFGKDKKEVNLAVVNASLHATALEEANTAVNQIYSEALKLKSLLYKSRRTKIHSNTVVKILDEMIYTCKSTWSSPIGYIKDSEKRRWGEHYGELSEIVLPSTSLTKQGGGNESNEEVKQRIHDFMHVAHSNSVRSIIMRSDKLNNSYMKLMDMLKDLSYILTYISTNGHPKAQMFASDLVLPHLESVSTDVMDAVSNYINTSKKVINFDKILGVHEKQTVVDTIRAVKTSRKSSVFSDTTKLMVLLKILRFGGQLIAIKLAYLFYMDKYVAYVAEKGENTKPPDLIKLLLMYLGMDAFIQLLIISVMVAAKFTTKVEEGRISIIDNEFLMLYMADYFMSTTIISVTCVLIAKIFITKRYIDLPNMGSSAVKAYTNIVIGVSGVVDIIPFYMIM